MAEDKFHFQIPAENIRSESFDKHGYGKSFFRTDYSSHGKTLRKATERLLTSEAKRKDYQILSDIYLQIQTPANTPVVEYRTNFEKVGFDIISFRDKKSNVATVRISKEKFNDLKSRLEEYIETPDNVGRSYFSAIEKLYSVPVESKIPTVKLAKTDKRSVVIDLYTDLNSREKFAANQAIVRELKKFDTEISDRTFENGVTSICCNLSSSNIQELAEEFSSIREVRLNETVSVEGGLELNELPNGLIIAKPKSNSKICVIDSGVNSTNTIFKGIVDDLFDSLPSGAVRPENVHGTFVASRCVFGDNINSCLETLLLEPYCKIIDVPTFGVDSNGKAVSTTDFWLRIKIEEVVNKLHSKVKVYNLSLGFDQPIQNYQFSNIAKLLDFLSKKYKVLFVIAAGNIPKLLGAYPSHHFNSPAARIGIAAESILAITVGAITKFENADSLSKRNHLAPFSKIGPGADLGMKPELVAHGGNLGASYKASPNTSAFGIGADGKKLAFNVGTSFAAPLISQYAQMIFDTYPNADPNLIKALLYHFTDERFIPSGLKSNHCTGFGEPIIEKVLSAGPHNATFIFEGKIDANKIQRIKFHIPKSLSAGKRDSRLQVKITLVYDPEVNEQNDAEYSKARITLKLYKNSREGHVPVSFANGGTYRLPWHPTLKFKKTFTKNYLPGDWEVSLKLFTRGKITTNYMQDFAVVIEVVDSKGGTDVYKDIETEFSTIYKRRNLKSAA